PHTRLPSFPTRRSSDLHARSKGGELLSSIYSNAKTRLRWRCKFHHEWLAMPSKVRQGTWCPYCASKQTRVELAEVPVVCRCAQADRKSTRLNSSHVATS